MNSNNNQSVYGSDTLKEFVLSVLTAIVSVIRSGTMILGTGALAVIDVVFGAMVLGLLFQRGGSVLTVPVSGSIIATLISLATSAVQMALWELILERKSGQRWGLIAIMGVLMALDTFCDTAIVTWLMYGESPANFGPANPDLLWFVAAALVFLITACNEILVVGLLRSLRKQP